MAMTRSCHAHCCAVSIIALLAVIQSGEQAQAQQLIANGTNEVASGTYNTIASGSSGYALWALNAGTIVGNGLVTITTGGSNASGAFAQGAGSMISLLDGGSIATVGNGGYGVDARLAGHISIVNVDVSTAAVSTNALNAIDGGTISADGGTMIVTGQGSYGARSTGAGSLITLNGVHITADKLLAYAVHAANDGTIVVNGAALRTEGDRAPALYAENILAPTGGTIIMDGGTITTTGNDAHGGRALAAGAHITLRNGVVINTEGAGSFGLLANDTATITSQDVEISTIGAGSKGLYAYGAGSITATGGTIITSGLTAIGAHASGTETNITLSSGVEISTSGIDAYGLFAESDGTINAHTVTVSTVAASAVGLQATHNGFINIDASSITTTGDFAMGASSSESFIYISNGTTLVTSGVGAHGAYTSTDGVISIYDSSVATSGDGAYGAYGAYTLGNTITSSGSSISTSGSNAYGAAAGLNGTLNIVAGSSIATTGTNSHAVLLADDAIFYLIDSTITATGSGAAAVSSSGTNSSSITGSVVSAADGAVFNVNAGGMNALVADSTVTGGDNLLNVASGSTLNVNALYSTLTGAAITAAGGVSNIDLQSTNWTVTGASNVTSLTNGAGSLVHFTPPGSSAGPFKTLTTQDYIGAGGTLGINTHLGGDGSPSDRMIVDGGAGIGSAFLSVNNIGGAGALTTDDGILVIDTVNGGTTMPGLFELTAPVIAGPYEYSLYKGGENGANPQSWYLRSDLDCELDPNVAECGGGGGDDIPDWRQDTSLYAAVPAMALLYGRLMLDTLHERRGTAVSAYAEGAPNAAWARVIGQHGDRDGGKGGIYGAGPKYDYDFWAFQGGMDLYRDGDVGTSRNHAGAFFAIGHGSGDV
ncbi:pertactin-like passenger domain-containing protein, partial [Hyphomicrobium sulfonivorans]|uniref:pertactin-like passenger domain-containing protein n=1 Tax=Hyphomicrobium sulfonivorans TaxID=121290 RepID=UPI0018DC9AAC